jgi:predicted  nucleic acid-binding Zn-ribbon protein
VSGFACMECGHKFRTIKSAERAAFGPNGCPKCGGADIDIASGPLAGAVAARKLETNPNGAES